MAIICGHRTPHYFSNSPPWDPPETPTKKEINEGRLWHCKDCNRWFSLLIPPVVKPRSEINSFKKVY
jgi:hypothetical protein